MAKKKCYLDEDEQQNRGKWRKRVEILRNNYEQMKLVNMLYRRRHVFIIVQQIKYFQELGTTCPINIDKILKSILKMSKHL